MTMFIRVIDCIILIIYYMYIMLETIRIYYRYNNMIIDRIIKARANRSVYYYLRRRITTTRRRHRIRHPYDSFEGVCLFFNAHARFFVSCALYIITAE